jgi:hypothetical protein
MMEAANISENFYQTAQRNILENGPLAAVRT